ncbi:MAG TPA: hypothetical protein H9743_00990 [Candidatus Mediterraneibacter vanvlietii]|nr:hypothetical protein [Candidatus Mediterraneibacter vanvlietii]
MRNIENTYVNYEELVNKVGKEVIESRIKQIAFEMSEFIKNYELQDFVYINEMLLTHAIMDYFSDIQRLKDYQKIEHINEVKIKAYETFWLLKRKPLQLTKQMESDKWLYVNEKFLLVRLTNFMLQDNINVPMVQERKLSFTNYLDTLYYYLKFRKTDAQALELMLLAFQAGKLIG